MLATSPGVKPTSWPCGTAPDSGRLTTWFAAELANLRTAFRWAADHGDLDTAATIATYAAFLGLLVDNYEPDRLGRRAHRTRPHRRPSPARVPVRDGVAVLVPWDGSKRLSATATPARWFSRSGRDEVPFGIEGWLGTAYHVIGRPNGRSSGAAPNSHAAAMHTQHHGRILVMALTIAGSR